VFDQLIESGGAGIKTKKPMTMIISIVLHVVAILVLIVIPLLFPEALSGELKALTSLIAPPPAAAAAATATATTHGYPSGAEACG